MSREAGGNRRANPAPRPSNARKVNAEEPLSARMAECEEGTRGHPVNLVAVDFYRQGDVFDVVRTLNAGLLSR